MPCAATPLDKVYKEEKNSPLFQQTEELHPTMSMRTSSVEAREKWRSFFEHPDTTVQLAREKLIQYQNYCRTQDPHQQLVPGYDMLSWIGVPMAQSMHKIRSNEVDQMMNLIPKLDFSNLKVLYHRLKTNWTSPVFRPLCIAILRRISVHREFTNFSKKIMDHHASLGDDVMNIPMKFLHQLWANDQHLTGVLRGTVFERIFRRLIDSYLENSVSKGVPHTNLVDLVKGVGGNKGRFLTPNETRAMNKHLTKKMLYYLSGTSKDSGDVHMHKILVRKMLDLIRKMCVVVVELLFVCTLYPKHMEPTPIF